MTTSSGDVPLTDLCAICHVEPIKYTCPRCGIHTCSLPCVKRHKQWAQCSGVRDPAAYRKRAELATPASIDQDFNFITKVERSLQRADDQVQEKGLHLAPANVRSRGPGGKSKFEHEVEDRGIKLVRAPQGLTRSRENKSNWAGQKGLMWTVEWIHQDGDRKVCNVSEKRPILEAYSDLVGRKHLHGKRKRANTEADSKTRAVKERKQDEQVENGAKNSRVQDSGERGQQESSIQNGDHINSVLQETKKQTVALTETAHDQPNSHDLETTYFYLHHPSTSSKLKCVMPIVGTNNLQHVLKDRTVFEFPTIYVRKQKPDELTEPFILESSYNGQEEKPIEPRLPTLPEVSTSKVVPLPENVDAELVLEVLQQDLNG